MQVHYQIIGFGVSIINFALVTMRIRGGLLEIIGSVWLLMTSLCGSLLKITIRIIYKQEKILLTSEICSFAGSDITDSTLTSLCMLLSVSLFNSPLISPSTPNQFSALWMLIKLLISWSSLMPPMSPPFPFKGPNTSWLYKGSLEMG